MKSRASFWAWMFFIIGVVSMAASVAMHYCFGTMGARLAERLRVLLFQAMLQQEMAWFDRPVSKARRPETANLEP